MKNAAQCGESAAHSQAPTTTTTTAIASKKIARKEKEWKVIFIYDSVVCALFALRFALCVLFLFSNAKRGASKIQGAVNKEKCKLINGSPFFCIVIKYYYWIKASLIMAKCRHHRHKSAACKTFVVWFCIWFFFFFYLLCFISLSQWPTKTYTRAPSLSRSQLVPLAERTREAREAAVLASWRWAFWLHCVTVCSSVHEITKETEQLKITMYDNSID